MVLRHRPPAVLAVAYRVEVTHEKQHRRIEIFHVRSQKYSLADAATDSHR
jgi:hypothetical protein